MADNDYLPTVDSIRLVRKALSQARKLDNAEKQVKESRVVFSGLSQVRRLV